MVEYKTETLIAYVAQILEDGYQLAINRGSDSGVKVGDKYLVYSERQEIIDPVTKKSLGNLEQIRGRGEVSQVYPMFSVLDSIEHPKKNLNPRQRTRFPGLISSEFNVYYAPFYNAKVGDLARPI